VSLRCYKTRLQPAVRVSQFLHRECHVFLYVNARLCAGWPRLRRSSAGAGGEKACNYAIPQ
jgi:hypothetical protein